MIFYDQFLRQFGVRLPSQLLSTRLHAINFFDIPKQSIFHFYDGSTVNLGPDVNELFLKKVTKPIYLQNIAELTEHKGNPRRIVPNTSDMINKFHQKHRRFVRMRSLDIAARDMNAVVMYNYNMLSHVYKYLRSTYTTYFEWYNVEATIWDNIERVANESNRHQFIMVKLPPHLLKVSELSLYANLEMPNQAFLKLMNTSEKLFMLELWKWLGPQRKSSILNRISKQNLGKINLVFSESGKWTFYNLGLLDSWRAPTTEELEANPELNKKGYKPLLFQKMVLRSLMFVQQARSVVQEEDEVEVNQPDAVDEEEEVGTQTTIKVDRLPTSARNTEDDIVDDSLKNPTLKQPNDPSATTSSDAIDPEEQVEVVASVKTSVEKDINKKALDQDYEVPEEVNSHLEDDLKQLEEMLTSTTEKAEEFVGAASEDVELSLDQAFMKVADRFAEHGTLTAADYNRFKRHAETYKTLPAPEGQTTLESFIQIPPQTLHIKKIPSIPDIPTVIDKTMLQSTLLDMDPKYIKEVMQKDIAAMVMNVQKAGIAVTNYQVETFENVAGAYREYVVRVQPIDGAAGTWKFRLPVVDDEGNYRHNDVKYRMRKQRGELPIRKINQSRVALTSYYGKIFIDRSDKKVNDYGDWLVRQVRLKGLDPADTTITNLHPGDAFDPLFKAPRIYTIMSQNFRDFGVTPTQFPEGVNATSYQLNFDHTKRIVLYGEEAINRFEKRFLDAQGKPDAIIIGRGVDGSYLILGGNGTVYATNGEETIPGWTMESLLNLDVAKAPIDFAELRYLGRSVPLGVILSYELGLFGLMALLGVTPRRVPVGARANLEANEFSLVFNDETLVFQKDNPLATLILAGFNEYHRTIREYDVHEFDKRGVYLNLFDRNGLTVRYLREIDLMYQLFIDPITLDLLKEMKEPTTFRGLLLRAASWLTVDTYPEEILRTKGYERLAGAVYMEIVNAIRSHNGRPGKSKYPVELNPNAVWKNISTDPSISLVSDINPVQNLKEMEAATFSGTGGRSTRSMVKRTRIYRDNELGTISESTVDSGMTGINIYLSANPQFSSLRGLSKPYDFKRDGATSLFSTSALLSPGSDRDDGKRVNFVGIQMGHTVACDGYHQMSVRTGYEAVIPHRVGDLFATTAKKPGKVLSKNATGIVVQYADGEVKGVELGRRFGDAAGLTIPHDLISPLKEGDQFDAGVVISYNDGFFEPDVLNPRNVVWKAGVLVKTALMESPLTFEDSSSISRRVSELLTTKITKLKEIVVNFDQAIHKLVKEKQSVEAEDILCIIEDPTTSNSGLFDDDTLDTLRVLSAQAPQAKVNGVIDRIEVFYNGEKEDMSESLRKLVIQTDRDMVARFKSAGKTPHNGMVNDSFRVDGNPLLVDTLVIRIYITHQEGVGPGDKGVFVNQMKTVFGEVRDKEMKTESGVVIDATFGQNSIDNRIVTSPAVIGTTNTLLMIGAKKVIDAYKS